MKTTNTEKSLKERKLAEFREILSDKMDTLRCLSCHKYFPDPCEDCSFAEVFDDVVMFFNEWTDSLLTQAKRETVEGERSRVRVRLNNFRKKQRNNGKCLYCKNDALKGFTSCKEHKERRRLLQKNNRALKREWKSGKLVPCPKCKGEWYNEKYKTICDVCEGVGKVAQGGKELTFKKAKQDATCTIHGEKGCFHSLNDLKSHLTDKKDTKEKVEGEDL